MSLVVLANCIGFGDPQELLVGSSFVNQLPGGLIPNIGKVVRVQEYPGLCFIITDEISPGDQVELTIENIYNTCDSCLIEECVKLTNCLTGETLIISNSVLISQYQFNNQIVVIQGYQGCWSISGLDEGDDCSCAISVVVLLTYSTCQDCLPVIAYKFTNCDNQSSIKYSTDDYSDYVGKTVKLDCGECWFVELINYTPPSTQDIVIENTFSSCVTCSRTYYQLIDCAGAASSIYTYTDLSDLVGQSIKIENSNSCWIVSQLTTPTIEQSSIASTIVVANTYINCQECSASVVCRCSIAWPDEDGTLSYINCTGALSTSYNLDPNTPTDKICVGTWLIARNPIYYGYCVDNECPVEVLPKRKIKPGYSTPTCDPVKYEKISCNASEILYKSVLKNRYGISNCCDELSDKWIIKKELIDLQSKIDSSYVCAPVGSCCNTPTCDCGCNIIVNNSCNS